MIDESFWLDSSGRKTVFWSNFQLTLEEIFVIETKHWWIPAQKKNDQISAKVWHLTKRCGFGREKSLWPYTDDIGCQERNHHYFWKHYVDGKKNRKVYEKWKNNDSNETISFSLFTTV